MTQNTAVTVYFLGDGCVFGCSGQSKNQHIMPSIDTHKPSFCQRKSKSILKTNIQYKFFYFFDKWKKYICNEGDADYLHKKMNEKYRFH